MHLTSQAPCPAHHMACTSHALHIISCTLHAPHIKCPEHRMSCTSHVLHITCPAHRMPCTTPASQAERVSEQREREFLSFLCLSYPQPFEETKPLVLVLLILKYSEQKHKISPAWHYVPSPLRKKPCVSPAPLIVKCFPVLIEISVISFYTSVTTSCYVK